MKTKSQTSQDTATHCQQFCSCRRQNLILSIRLILKKTIIFFPFFFFTLIETQLQHSYTRRRSACGIEWIEIDKKMFLYGRINGTDRIAASRVYNATRTRHRSAPRITTRVAGTSPSLLRLLCLLRLRVFRCFIMNFMTFSFFFSSSISCFSHYFLFFLLESFDFLCHFTRCVVSYGQISCRRSGRSPTRWPPS